MYLSNIKSHIYNFKKKSKKCIQTIDWNKICSIFAIPKQSGFGYKNGSFV